MLTLDEIMAYLNQLAPTETAASWDNVGLLLGDPKRPIERVMTCLTVTPPVVAEAVEQHANLIVTHHPILFRGVKTLATTSSEGQLLQPLLTHSVAVYSAHTAYDNCRDGINDRLCQRFGLNDIGPLRPARDGSNFKLVIFTPDSDLERVSDAVFAAGAGKIGHYEQCSYRSAGTGTFFGTAATNPAVGQKGRREHVSEWRLEVIVPEAKLAKVLQAMRSAHSYEEPAFDLYPLKTWSVTSGEGRVGHLKQPITLHELAQKVREVLPITTLGVVGPSDRQVQRVAVACGAAGEYLGDAIRLGADVFVTGEMRFHDMLAAQAAGVAVLLPGHYASERPGVEDLAKFLSTEFPQLHVWASQCESDPVWWLNS